MLTAMALVNVIGVLKKVEPRDVYLMRSTRSC